MAVKKLSAEDSALVDWLLLRFKGYDAAQSLEFLRDPRTVLFVAVDDAGDTVGWLYAYELIRPEGRRAMLLYEVDVIAGAQGRGHGRALVEALVEEARVRGHFEMWLLMDSDNEAARSLYESVGGEASKQTMFTWELGKPGSSPMQ